MTLGTITSKNYLLNMNFSIMNLMELDGKQLSLISTYNKKSNGALSVHG